MLLPSAIQRSDDLVGIATPIDCPFRRPRRVAGRVVVPTARGESQRKAAGNEVDE